MQAIPFSQSACHIQLTERWSMSLGQLQQFLEPPTSLFLALISSHRRLPYTFGTKNGLTKQLFALGQILCLASFLSLGPVGPLPNLCWPNRSVCPGEPLGGVGSPHLPLKNNQLGDGVGAVLDPERGVNLSLATE